MKIYPLFLFTLFIFSLQSFSQKLLTLDNGCVYSGEVPKNEVYSFDSDAQAEEALNNVMKHTGLPANFVIRAADVANAQASVFGPTRYILYNQYFLLRVRQQTNTDWAAISILAHEIGHHLSGHTLDGLGSRPSKELEADRFSGFVLAKMGATIEESLIAMNNIASDYGSATHPAKSARLAAITNGWQAAKDIDRTTPSTRPLNIPTETLRVPKTPPTSYIQTVTTDYNIFQDGIFGMRFHIKLNINNMKGNTARPVVYFYFNNGTPLKDYNGIYCARDGNVCVAEDFTPGYDNAVYNDLQIFMPYSELHMSKGRFDLKFNIQIFDSTDPVDARSIGQSGFFMFYHNM